jgi:membrane protease YdiL (CAAX protease family)
MVPNMLNSKEIRDVFIRAYDMNNTQENDIIDTDTIGTSQQQDSVTVNRDNQGYPVVQYSTQLVEEHITDCKLTVDEYGNKFGLITTSAKPIKSLDNVLTIDDVQKRISVIPGHFPIYAESTSHPGWYLVDNIMLVDSDTDIIHDNAKNKVTPVLNATKTSDITVDKQDTVMLWISNCIQNILFVAITIGVILFVDAPQYNILSVLFGNTTNIGLNCLVTVIGTLLCVCCAVLLNTIRKKTNKKKYLAEQKAQRQGVIGEMYQQNSPWRTSFFLFTGIGEEMLFRCGFTLLFWLWLSSTFGDLPVIFPISLVVANIVFTVAHIGTYKSAINITGVFLLGLILSAVFYLTGGIIWSAITHAIYDWAVVTYNAKQLRKYGASKIFSGKRPIAVLTKKEPTHIIEH